MADLLSFLARLLNAIGSSSALPLTFPCDNQVFHVSFPNLFYILLVTSSQTSSIMAGKKNQNGRFIVIFQYTLIILLCGAIT